MSPLNPLSVSPCAELVALVPKAVAGEALVVLARRLAPVRPAHAGASHEVSLVVSLDERPRRENAAVYRRQPGQPRPGLVDTLNL